MAKGKKTGGRKAGTPNKLSLSVKESVLSTYKSLGGDKAMAIWARENQTEFYKIYAKLLPTEVSGPDGADIPVGIKVSFVNAADKR